MKNPNAASSCQEAGGNSIIDIITEPFKTVDGYEDFNTLMLVTPPTSDGYPGSIKINSQSFLSA